MAFTGRTPRALLAVLALSACFGMSARASWLPERRSEKTIIVTAGKDGKTVELRKRSTLTIKLETRPGTGYGWQVVKGGADLLEPVGAPSLEKADNAAPGATELQVFSFKARASGSTFVELHYLRRWEKGVPPAKTFRVRVHIHR